jgi:hypothetical protein
MQNPETNCAFCTEVFVPKRIDAKYCCRKCQSTAYNRSKAKNENYLKSILPVICKNRNILKKIVSNEGKDGVVVSPKLLTQQGFKMGYLTMYWFDAKSKREIHFIGDYSLEMLSDETYKIKKNERF